MLIVDGMNVIGSRPDGWWRDRDGAKRRLVAVLARYAEESGNRVTVVLDGGPVERIEPDGRSGRVKILFASRRGPDAADEDIVRLVGEAEHPDRIDVVSSDAALVARVRALGAEALPASSFRDQIDALRS